MTTTARPSDGRLRVVAAMEPKWLDRLLDDAARDRLRAVADLAPGVLHDPADPAFGDALAAADGLLTCWGAPPLDAAFLRRAPRLRFVVHAAGSVKPLLTDAAWQRGIAVSSGAAVNARPVAEFTVAAIVLANKRAAELAHRYRARRSAWRPDDDLPDDIGNHRRVVGVVGASRIGRLVIELLRPFDLTVVVHDRFLADADAAALGVTPVDLDDLCSRSDVVTLHAPALPATRHLIDARRLALLRDGATLINTARGSLVDTAALTAELASGRIAAVLDHTEPEVLPDDSPLYDLPNVVLTPHIAGSLGNELRRLGDAAVDELERAAAGRPFARPVDRAEIDRLA